MSMSICIALHFFWFDLINFLSQYSAWEIQAAFPGERAAIVRCYPAFPPPCFCVQSFRVSIPVSVRPTLSFQMDIVIFNMRTNVAACHTRRGVRHKQVCTRVDSEGQKNYSSLPRQGIEPMMCRFEFWLTTELRSPHLLVTAASLRRCQITTR